MCPWSTAESQVQSHAWPQREDLGGIIFLLFESTTNQIFRLSRLPGHFCIYSRGIRKIQGPWGLFPLFRVEVDVWLQIVRSSEFLNTELALQLIWGQLVVCLLMALEVFLSLKFGTASRVGTCLVGFALYLNMCWHWHWGSFPFDFQRFMIASKGMISDIIVRLNLMQRGRSLQRIEHRLSELGQLERWARRWPVTILTHNRGMWGGARKISRRRIENWVGAVIRARGVLMEIIFGGRHGRTDERIVERCLWRCHEDRRRAQRDWRVQVKRQCRWLSREVLDHLELLICWCRESCEVVVYHHGLVHHHFISVHVKHDVVVGQFWSHFLCHVWHQPTDAFIVREERWECHILKFQQGRRLLTEGRIRHILPGGCTKRWAGGVAAWVSVGGWIISRGILVLIGEHSGREKALGGWVYVFF